jgi:CubicO group peptidase (beta-lactamase class C family)
MKKILYSFFVFLLSFAAVAQVNPRLQRIDSLMNHFYSNGKFMGSVTIREKDNVIFEKAYGFADVQSKIAANTNTKYKIGSITKMFTASVIFQLIESKKITLATKLSAFYPEIKNAEKITISHLLGHQSGIYNYTNDVSFKTYCTTPQTKKQMLSRIASYEPVFEPGEKAEYSNSNYVLLGYIIEDVTKKNLCQKR